VRMRVTVEPAGVSTATVIMTQDEVDAIRGKPGRARVPIAITFKGKTFRTSVSFYRGQWMLVVNKEMRDGGLVPGRDYTVDISVDTQERTVEVPADLAAALRRADVRAAFDALSYTARKEYVRAIEGAKKPETRQRRIDAAVAAVSG
jgi:hypothetical protein